MRWIIIGLLVLQPVHAGVVSFSRDLAPILSAKCLACHNAEKPKGKYRVDTFSEVVKGISEERVEESELLKRLVADDVDERMPQKDEPLPAEQIALFKTWIREGAKLDAGSPDTLLNELLPRPPYPSAPANYRRAVPIVALAFDPAGEFLAVNGYHEVTLWTTNGELQRRIGNVPARARGLAFHPDGSCLAVAGGDPGRHGELSLYTLDGGELQTTLVRAADELLTVAFSADGKHLAAGGADNSIHVFDWATKTRIFTIRQHSDWVTSLTFSPAGTHLASASRDRTARIYDMKSGELEVTYPNQNNPLYGVGFITNDLVASAGRDPKVHLWSLPEGKKKNEVGGFSGDIYQLAISGENLFIAGSDKSVRQYSTADRKLVRTFSGSGDAIYALAVHAGQGTLASGSYDGEVRIWKVADGSLLTRFVAAPGFRVAARTNSLPMGTAPRRFQVSEGRTP